jgi:hypothetical protein
MTPLAKDELSGPRGAGYRRMIEGNVAGQWIDQKLAAVWSFQSPGKMGPSRGREKCAEPARA